MQSAAAIWLGGNIAAVLAGSEWQQDIAMVSVPQVFVLASDDFVPVTARPSEIEARAPSRLGASGDPDAEA